MDAARLSELLERYGVMVSNSHVVYTSGKHGSAYFNKDALYPHTSITRQLGEQFAELFAPYHPDAVIAPAVGGVALSQWTANALSRLLAKEVLSVYADKAPDGTFVVKRGYDKLIHSKRVLALEDVLNTGGSLKRVIAATRDCEAHVVGAGVLCNRGMVTKKDIGNPPILHALWNLNLDAWDEVDCPLCKAGVPINTDVGKGREYLEKKVGTG